MAIHKGTELNNVNETWKQNEQRRQNGEDDPVTGAAGTAGVVNEDLQQTIRDGAAEYDNANKEDRLLDGERATLNDGRTRDSDE